LDIKPEFGAGKLPPTTPLIDPVFHRSPRAHPATQADTPKSVNQVPCSSPNENDRLSLRVPIIEPLGYSPRSEQLRQRLSDQIAALIAPGRHKHEQASKPIPPHESAEDRKPQLQTRREVAEAACARPLQTILRLELIPDVLRPRPMWDDKLILVE